MKKRLLSALLALALVFVLLPTTALAETVTANGDISIAGYKWNFEKDSDSNYKTVYYQPQQQSKGIISDFSTVYKTNPYLEITREGNTITVIVHDAVTITTNKGTNDASEECIEVNKSNNGTSTLDLVITGAEGKTNNTLTLECQGYGSALSSYQGDITITGGVTVNANSTYSNSNTGVSARAINVFNGDLIISSNGTTVNAENKDSNHPTIDVKNTVTISDGATLTAKNTSGGKAISFDSITAPGYDFKYWTTSGYTALTGDDKATKLQKYSNIKFTPTVVQKDNDVSIAGDAAVIGVETKIPTANGSGTYFYDQNSKTLTLKDVTINKTSNNDSNAIKFAAEGTYTVNLVGTNKISNVSTGISTDNVKKYAINVILSGSGSLDISARGLAIEVPSGNLTFNNTGAITLATTNTTVSGINAIQVSGSISIGNDFNKNLEIKAGEDTFDLNHSDFNALNNHKTITIAPKPSKTYYNNTALKYGETKPAGSGTISCDENGAVTLTNVNDSTGTLVFYAESKPSSITLIGDSTLSAVETKYQSLTISGSGSLTVGSIRVPNNTTTPNSPSLTIDGARVTAGTTTSTTRAVEVKGDLTVKNKATLIANSKTDSVPTVQVGGNATFTGSTVTITNYSTTQGGQDKDSYEASSALHVDGAITISGGSVTAGAQAGGNAIRAVGDITVSNGAQVTATNHSQYFSAITAGKADSDKIVNVLSTLIVSGENTNITATNSHDNSSTGAIHAKIKNANASNYLKLNNNATAIAPNAEDNTSGSYVTITRGAAYTAPTTYTVTITAGENMTLEKGGALIQKVTKGAAITEVKFIAASGHYFPADYVSKMNLPEGFAAEVRENSWYLIISGTPTSDVPINLPAASVRPTITVSMPTPVAGNTPATASDITLTYSDTNKSINKQLTISNVVWQSYVSNGNESITPGNTLSSGDKFVEGTEYFVTIDFEVVSEDYAIVPAAGTTAWSNAAWGPRTMTLYFDATGAPCTHEYTDDWHANGNTHWHECKRCKAHADEVAHTFGDWITDTSATDTTDGSKHRTCSVCQYKENATIPKTGTGEIEPPTPDNPGTIVIIRPAEEEKPAQQPNPSTGANDLVGLAVAAAVAAALGSAALLRKHD